MSQTGSQSQRAQTAFEATKAEVNWPLWWAGWRAPWAIASGALAGLAVGAAVRAPIVILVLGGLIGLWWWYFGREHVDDIGSTLVASFVAGAEREARRILGLAGEDTTTHTIWASWGNVWGVPLDRWHVPTVLVIGESSVAIYDDAKLDLKRVSTTIGQGTRELFYDQISSVNYDRPFFEIKMTDGDVLQYRSSRKPDDVLYELQQRVRAFKTK